MQIHDHAPNVWGRSFLWGGILLGLLLVAAFLTHGFGLLGAAQATDSAPTMLVRQGDQVVIPEGSPLRKRLTVAPVHAEAVSPKISLPAIVESDPAGTAAVLTPLGGRVLEIKAGLGDRVQQGQVLAVIDSPDLGQAYDDNDKAAATFQLTQKNLARQEEQFKLGTASTRDLDQARSDDAQAAAEYARTRARLKTLGVTPERPLRSTLLVVRAPVAGSVTALSIARGNMINDPTQPIMTVADLSTVWVTAMVPEKDIPSALKGVDADVTLSAYPDRVLHGKVSFVSDIIEPDSRRNKLRISFPNADVSLKPNMFATVVLAGAAGARVVLPTSALLMNNDRTTVFVATAPWTFERRTVDAPLQEGQTVAVLSGVKDGDQVVVKGGILLND
jgi:membrane fusion protein, heavy metal efflux system